MVVFDDDLPDYPCDLFARSNRIALDALSFLLSFLEMARSTCHSYGRVVCDLTYLPT